MYLLDTNVVSEMRKRRPHGAVLAWLQDLRSEDIQIPAVVIAELQKGVEVTRRQDHAKARELESWIDKINLTYSVLPMDGHHFRRWSRLMAGHSDDLSADAMIAAQALVEHRVVATRNVRDFAHFGVEVYNPFTHPKKEAD